MPLSFKKLLLFLTLLFGAGALLLSLMILTAAVVSTGPFSAPTATIVVASLVCVAWGVLIWYCAQNLIALYREELRACTGSWHLSLSEVLIATLVAGMLMLVAQLFCTRDALPYGITAAFLLGLYFTGDLLISARKGNNTAALKTVGAIGTMLKVLGWGTVLVALVKTSESDFANRLMFAYGKTPPEGNEASVLNLIRFGLLCLPTGFLLTTFATQFSNLPPQTEGVPEQTLRKLLDVKSELKHNVDNEGK